MTRFLAVDYGGTRSQALVIDAGGTVVESLEGPGANLHTVGGPTVASRVSSVLEIVGRVDGVVLSIAGLRTPGERDDLVSAMRGAGISVPLAIFSDSAAALRAAEVREGAVIVAGTGSSAYARTRDGREARAGGWGSRLGDEGSGYWIGRHALSTAIRAHDEGDTSGAGLLAFLLQDLGMDEVTQLRALAQRPHAVSLIANLTHVVGTLAASGNTEAIRIVSTAAAELARLARVVVSRLELGGRCTVVLAGGVLTHCDGVAPTVERLLGDAFCVEMLTRDPALGAFWLSQEEDRWNRTHATRTPVTEAASSISNRIDQLPALQMLEIMNRLDGEVAPAVTACLADLAELVDDAARLLRLGGRLVYVGAGTSGRLAMLDAVECVPTFGIAPGLVLALVAGGNAALTGAVEGAEDDAAAGDLALREVNVCASDIVVGVSASGSAEYVRAAVQTARALGARTALITCNPMARSAVPADHHVVAQVGPEVIAGSTRLKSGTAQKMILNMLSTAVMIRLGRTRGNKMTSVLPTNRKLRERAIRLVVELTGASDMRAIQTLQGTDWGVEAAVRVIQYEDARIGE